MKKILIIKMSALGDLFMALPQIDAIIAQHPGDEMWIMTSPPFREIFSDHPLLKTVILDRNKKFGTESRMGRILWVRREKFDEVYDLQGNKTSRLLTLFSAAPRRIGSQPMKIYTHSPTAPYTSESRYNVFKRLNEILVSAGLKPASENCTVYPPDTYVRKVEEWKKAHGLCSRKYVVFHAGSSSEWATKRWPEEYFREVALLFENQGYRSVWTGGPDESGINRRLAEKVGIDASGQLGFLELFVLGRDAEFAITNDSGPMHILAASGIPVFSFFGPTSWVRSHAVGQRNRVLTRGLDCSPCFLKKCPPERDHACMREISPEYVCARIHEDLHEGRRTGRCRGSSRGY